MAVCSGALLPLQVLVQLNKGLLVSGEETPGSGRRRDACLAEQSLQQCSGLAGSPLAALPRGPRGFCLRVVVGLRGRT